MRNVGDFDCGAAMDDGDDDADDDVIANDVSLSEVAPKDASSPKSALLGTDANNNAAPVYDGSVINIVPSGDAVLCGASGGGGEMPTNVINIVPVDQA